MSEDLLFELLLWAALLLLLICFYIGLFFILRTSFDSVLKNRKFRSFFRSGSREGKLPPWLLKLCFVREGMPEVELYNRLLASCGWYINGAVVIVGKRLAYAAALVLPAGASIVFERVAVVYSFSWIQAAVVSILLIVLLQLDQMLLRAMAKRRSRAIVEEIYEVSRNLVYCASSRLSLHARLMKCLPFTRVIRPQFTLLLNCWYSDSEKAIQQFQQSLGTEEVFTFAETLQSLRSYDSEAFYELLRRQMDDYKEKLILLKSDRKESISYVLFVLAGLPIVNTFRVFVYPWVQEGKKLFDYLQ
ncbi:hypothetical protein [Paenibacillus turpanensis]|uniref:hypothetical protein n=1 Tax=Paenibacillus turpanensis TaxID=2689078 RepID=UPI001409A563|nr:hypothetical protein [Paenibacillus turpanensis]